jgi:cell division protein FtsW
MGMKLKIDYFLTGIIVFFLFLTILILTSASAALSQEKVGVSNYYLKHQIIYGIMPGIALLWFFLKIKKETLEKIVLPLFLLSLFFLLLVFIPPFGSSAKGASRWFNFGPIVFQPSEFLKISFILYLASWLRSKTEFSLKKESPFWSKNLFLFLAILLPIIILLIKQPDLSTLGIICIVAFLMYFLSGAPVKHILIIFFIGLLIFSIFIFLAPYRFNRFLTFLNPELADSMGQGWHARQILITIGSGGWNGLGLGLSRQKFGFLPESMSDSIFAIYAEEIGFIGSLILISLFLLFLRQGFKIANKAGNSFLRLSAFGITCWITIQAFINIAGMVGLFPLAGIPLPFLSYGGSATVAELAGIGILLNISKQS